MSDELPPTPETDAQSRPMTADIAMMDTIGSHSFPRDSVPADFARRLERERDEARAEHKSQCYLTAQAILLQKAAEIERDEARQPGWYQACLTISSRLAPHTKADGVIPAVDEVLADLVILRARVSKLEAVLTDLQNWQDEDSVTGSGDYDRGLMCGIEDRGIEDRYEAMRYGYDRALERVSERIDPVIAEALPKNKEA